MAELEYSVDALNARSAFFGAKTIVYVEGDDDVLFWQEVFSRVADARFEVEPVGGSPQLDRLIAQIEAGTLHAIAARDADFLPFLGLRPSNPKVVHTFGYSIENSLYVADCVAHLTRLWCRTTRVTHSECESWLREFATHLAPLVYRDLANSRCHAGVQTLGDNCTRFMNGRHSPTPCDDRIEAHRAEIDGGLPPDEVSKAHSDLGSDPESVLTHIRGHFLASAVMKYIVSRAKAIGRKVSVPAEAMYAAALTHFGRTLATKHPHSGHYFSAATQAWNSI